MTVCSECGLPDCTECFNVPCLAPSPEEIAKAVAAIRQSNYDDQRVFGRGYGKQTNIREYVGMRQGDKYHFEAR